MGTAFLIAGLGFGDEGKGSVVDYLTRTHGVDTVIRYNGGAQAAHNVVTDDGLHHTFAQFGSGTLAGAQTFLSEHVIVNPFTLLNEAKHLESLGISNPIELVSIDPRARITTPFHVASNRLHEIARGDGLHGSCGMGVGETVRMDLRFGVALKAGHFKSPNRLLMALNTLRKILLIEAREIATRLPDNDLVRREMSVLEDPNLDYIIETFRGLNRLVTDQEYVDRLLQRDKTTIFEGAQGMLLDQDFGFHPHTTWSDITFRNAESLLREAKHDGTVRKFGLLRSHMTRHGAGPFPTEDSTLTLPGDHNCYGPWQRNFRVGHLDLVLTKYALKAIGGVDNLVVSHLDLFKGDFAHVCTSYLNEPELELPVGEPDSPVRLGQQQHLGDVLRRVTPVKQRLSDSEELLGLVQSYLGTAVRLISDGPTSKNKRIL